MSKKLTNKEVKNILTERDLKLCSGENYKSIDDKIKCVDSEGYIIHQSLYNIRKSPAMSRFGNSNIYTIENINNYIKKHTKGLENIQLISTTYEKSNKPLIFNCDIHGQFEISWNAISSGNRCKKCGHVNSGITQTKTHTQYLDEVFKLVGNEYTVLGIYSLAKEKILIRHNKCGREYEIKADSLLRGTKCLECSPGNIKNWIGEKHPRYKPSLTAREREDRRIGFGNAINIWRTQIFERDNYTCEYCGKRGKGMLNAHHLDGYNWCKDKRFDVKNGTTLCRECHNKFHSIYKCGENTTQQFKEFLKRKASI